MQNYNLFIKKLNLIMNTTICIIHVIINYMNDQNSNNLRDYYDFLKQYKVQDSDNSYTHVAIGEPWGRYNIPDEKLNNLINIYSKCVGYSSLHLAERNKPISPLVLNINLITNENKRHYSIEDIENIIDITNNIIKTYYEIKSDTLLAYVMEKPVRELTEICTIETVNYRDGFRIIYPNFPSSECMRTIILNELKSECTKYNIFEHLNLLNSIDNIFDGDVVNKNGVVLMYSSIKNGGPLYKLTKIYNDNMINSFFGADLPLREHAHFVKILSNRQYKDTDELPFIKTCVDDSVSKDDVCEIPSPKVNICPNSNEESDDDENNEDKDNDEDNDEDEDNDDEENVENNNNIETSVKTSTTTITTKTTHPISKRKKIINIKDCNNCRMYIF